MASTSALGGGLKVLPAAPLDLLTRPADCSQTREERMKERELLEARKAGTVAPEKDAEGNDINPHIPLYIAQAPWYLNATTPGLKHQKAIQSKQYEKNWYQRGETQGPAATKWRKGACENCGAMTHDAKVCGAAIRGLKLISPSLQACVERPRKLGARWTNKEIRADEVVQEVSLDFEGKRDRWNGYDPSMHTLLLEQFEKTEEEKRKRKEEMLQKKFMTEPDPAHGRFPSGAPEGAPAANGDGGKLVAAAEAQGGAEAAEEEDEFGLQEEGAVNDAPVAKMDPKTRSTIRNLRIREDTAKYLRNLDPSSAYYDPKSRSMREDPTPHLAPEDVRLCSPSAARCHQVLTLAS